MFKSVPLAMATNVLPISSHRSEGASRLVLLWQQHYCSLRERAAGVPQDSRLMCLDRVDFSYYLDTFEGRPSSQTNTRIQVVHLW